MTDATMQSIINMDMMKMIIRKRDKATQKINIIILTKVISITLIKIQE